MDEDDFAFATVKLPCTHNWKGANPCPFCSGELGRVEEIEIDEAEQGGN